MVNDKITEFLESVLGYYKVRGGGNYSFYSPFVVHHKPKFDVWIPPPTSKSNVGWKCWITDKKGRSLASLMKTMRKEEFVQIARNLDLEFQKTRRSFDLAMAETILTGSVLAQDTLQWPRDTCSIYEGSTLSQKLALGSLYRRGVTDADIQMYNIKYSPSNGVLFPSHDESGKLRFMVAKNTDKNAYHKLKGSDPDHVIWGDLISPRLSVVLTEGPFDAITVGVNSIPKFGKYVPSTLCRWFMYHNVEVIEFSDGDAAGKQASFETCFKLLTYDINVKRVNTPDDKDPSDLGRERCSELIANAQPVSLFDLITEQL